MINNMTQSERCFVHAFSQPNRGYQGPDKVPYYQQEDFDWMASIAGPLDVRGWKLYCGWGDPGMGSAPSRGIVGEEDGYSAESNAAILLQGLDIPDFSRERITKTVNELQEERDAVSKLGLV